jgi:tetratricopeptide (TPR) repeat protein
LILRQKGDQDKALESYQKRLYIREKYLPADHAEMGAIRNNLGNNYFEPSQYDLAMKHLNRSLSLQHSDFAITYDRCLLPLEHSEMIEIEKCVQRISSKLS